MRRTRSRLSPSRLVGFVGPALVLSAVGALAIIVACQAPEPFHLDGAVPGTGGTTETGGRNATGGRATGGGPGTGGRPTGGGPATGGRASGGGIVPTGGLATGGRASGGIFGGGGMRTGGASFGGSASGGSGLGGVSGACATSTVNVMLKAGSVMASGNSINVALQVLNTGGDTITVSNLKLRYYFSFKPATGMPTPKIIYEVDNTTVAGNNKAAITSTVNTTTPAPATATGAENYLEIAFTTLAGTLTPANNFTVEGRLHDSAYQALFSAASDYSYVASATAYTKDQKVVATLGTAASSCIAWGVPPQ